MMMHTASQSWDIIITKEKNWLALRITTRPSCTSPKPSETVILKASPMNLRQTSTGAWQGAIDMEEDVMLTIVWHLTIHSNPQSMEILTHREQQVCLEKT